MTSGMRVLWVVTIFLWQLLQNIVAKANIIKLWYILMDNKGNYYN